MSKHILFNEVTGALAARYDSAINSEIPTSALEVSEELFFRTMNEQDGIWTLVGSDIVKLPLPEPEPVDPRASMVCTAFQAHAAIAREPGLYDQVTALMNHPDTPFEVKLAWTKAQDFKRLSPTVLTMGAALGLTDTQLDDLFALAVTIDA